MSIDVEAAQQFIFANARLLDRHRLAMLRRGGAPEPVLAALRAYRNSDGGFGHALEPDVRAPDSEPASTLHALEVLAEIGRLDDLMVAEAAAWISSVADDEGGVPFVTAACAAYPHAPWMVPSDGGSHLTFAIAGLLWEAGSEDPWLTRATEWCWRALAGPDELGGYFVKFALGFLDRVGDDARAHAAIETLHSRIGADGSIPVAGGTDNERLLPLALSPRPRTRSRALFTDAQIDADLRRLEAAQQPDGGWLFDWLAWSPGQAAEWRGAVTLQALETLKAHGRI